jgi:AcrR family transcriptional regulator
MDWGKRLRRSREKLPGQGLTRDDVQNVCTAIQLGSNCPSTELTIGNLFVQPLRLSKVSKKTKYESRDEVEKRLQASTLELLLDLPPDDITLRQIAEKAECHHPNIPTYFGSKAVLFEAVFPGAVAAIAASNIPSSFRQPSKELIRLVRLAAWLEHNSVDFFDQRPGRPLLKTLSDIYISRFNVNELDAHLLSQRLVALMMGAILYPSTIGLQSDEFMQQFDLEMRIVQHLAKDTPIS